MAKKNKTYRRAMEALQLELAGLHRWLQHGKQRMVVLFEGRDAAGKGGTIKAITESMDTRGYHIASLPKPSETESTQWYFQRYVAHLPSAGEIALFDHGDPQPARGGVQRGAGANHPAADHHQVERLGGQPLPGQFPLRGTEPIAKLGRRQGTRHQPSQAGEIPRTTLPVSADRNESAW